MLNYTDLNKIGWKNVKLGYIATEINERVASPEKSELDRFVGLEHMESGELEVEKWTSTKGLISSAKKFRTGDILFARRNVYLQRASQVSFDGVCSGDAFVLRENHEQVIPGFLSIVLNSNLLWEYAIANAAGTMSKRVKWRDLCNFSFQLPPKEDQHEICKLIWACYESLSKKRELHKLLEMTKHSEFKERCSAEVDAQHIPVSKLLIEPPKNGFSPKCNSEGKGLRTVSISAVNKGQFLIRGNVKYAEVDRNVLDKFDVRSDDVFIVRGNGNKNLCGKAGLSRKNYEGLFYPDLLIRLRFNQNIILPRFASFQWNTERIHSQLIRVAKSTNGIWKVNGDDIKRHNLLVLPLPKQIEIIERLDDLEQCRQHCSDAIIQTKKMLSALINTIL